MIKSIKLEDSIKAKPNIQIGIRETSLIIIFLSLIFLAWLILYGSNISMDQITVNLKNKNIAPNFSHIFGTDWMGRDMFLRVTKGLSISIKIGILSSAISGIVALIIGVLGATMGNIVDFIITWIIDLWLSIPHPLIIILISVVLGGGLKGIVIGISITHWPSLARIIRAEVIQLKQSEYVKISKRFGKNNLYIALNHILPHIIPQLLIGIVIIFPHAILHEASITFLGFGLPPHEPAIGIILSESMKYLISGKWWLVFFPGATLVFISFVINSIAKQINKLIKPMS